MSKSTTSPSCFCTAIKARLPPICPPPMSPIFFFIAYLDSGGFRSSCRLSRLFHHQSLEVARGNSSLQEEALVEAAFAECRPLDLFQIFPQLEDVPLAQLIGDRLRGPLGVAIHRLAGGLDRGTFVRGWVHCRVG